VELMGKWHSRVAWPRDAKPALRAPPERAWTKAGLVPCRWRPSRLYGGLESETQKWKSRTICCPGRFWVA
jgi:hypothetical protein